MAKKKIRIEDYSLELENADYDMLEQLEDVQFAKLIRAWWEYFRGNEYEKYLSPENRFQFEYLIYRTNKRRMARYEKYRDRSEKGKAAVEKRWNDERKKKEKIQNPTLFAETEDTEKYSFEDFYNAFDNKKKPEAARKAWSKLTEEEKALAMEKVGQYVAFVRHKAEVEHWETKTYFQMLPSSYLNGKCWKGEYKTPDQPSDGIPYADVEVVEKYPFEKFWKIYGKDVGYDKCLQVWKQISEETKAKIMAHVVKYVQARPNEYYRKDPINYFKDRTYEDKVITNNQSASSYGSNNRQSYKEAEFERNARTIVDTLERAEKGEFAYLSPFNPPSGQR